MSFNSEYENVSIGQTELPNSRHVHSNTRPRDENVPPGLGSGLPFELLDSTPEDELDWQPYSQLLYDTSDAVARPHIDQSDLLCRTGCGFYGYPAWQGHCSKCYKELQAKKSFRKKTGLSRPVFDPSNIKNKVSRSVSDVSDLPGKATQLINRKIDKLDEKRRLQLGRHKHNNNIVKNIFKKNSNTAASKEGRDLSWTSPFSSTSSFSSSVSQELDDFLKTLSKDGAALLKKQVNSFVEKLRRHIHSQALEDTADQLQELYLSMHNTAKTHPAFAGLSQEDAGRVVLLVERFVTTQLHTELRAVVNPRSEEQDLATQNRIRSLSWVSSEQLESKLDDCDDGVNDAMDEIIGELLQLDGLAVPSEKLQVLVSCSHGILQALSSRASTTTPASADDFLPALILCVIRANPPMLHSNIAYITNFAPHDQLQSGEAGYYFTNLCCAVAFIEKVCGASLGLTEQEFARFMSGKSLPRQPKPPPSVTSLTNCLLRCDRAAEILDTVSSLYEATVEDMISFQTHVSEQVSQVLEESPLPTRAPHSVASVMQALSDGKDGLLLPEFAEQNTSQSSSVTAAPDLPPRQQLAALPVDRSTKPTTSAFKQTLPECREAFDLYYSLEDFMTGDLTSPSRAVASSLGASYSKATPALPGSSFDAGVSERCTSVGSLLDEPVSDATVPLLEKLENFGSEARDTASASLPETNTSVSLLDEPVSPLSSAALLLPEYTGFRVQSHLIQSIPCDTGPTSLPCSYNSGISPASVPSQPSSLIPVSGNNVNNSSARPSESSNAAQKSSLSLALNLSPSDACTQKSAVKETKNIDIPSDAFASPQNRPLLPPPLFPSVSPSNAAQSLGIAAASSTVSEGCIEPSAVSKGHIQGESSHLTQAPTQQPKKDALDKMVDVLAGIADSIDQIL